MATRLRIEIKMICKLLFGRSGELICMTLYFWFTIYELKLQVIIYY